MKSVGLALIVIVTIVLPLISNDSHASSQKLIKIVDNQNEGRVVGRYLPIKTGKQIIPTRIYGTTSSFIEKSGDQVLLRRLNSKNPSTEDAIWIPTARGSTPC